MTQDPESRFPDFIVPGAQKAGTTWLFECLQGHPDIFVPKEKELHYFCAPDLCRHSTNTKGIDWYLSHFSRAEDNKVTGEMSVDYMIMPRIAEQLYQRNPDLKIIFMLRSPVDRAYSGYWMWRRNNLSSDASLIERCAIEEKILQRSKYSDPVKAFLNLFGKDQVKVKIYEEVFSSPHHHLKDLFKFLEVDAAYLPPSMNMRIAPTRALTGMRGKMFYKVLGPVINSPLILPVWRAVRAHTNSTAKAKSTGSRTERYPEMTSEEREYLEQQLGEDREKFFELIGRRVKAWDPSPTDSDIAKRSGHQS